jgi:hypothetical protein
MLRNTLLLRVVLPACIASTMLGSASTHALGSLSAAQLIDKNVAAKGGLQTWRSVQTITFSGKMDAGGKSKTQLPFVLEKKRSRKSRVELTFKNDTAVQVYDGANGWKLRPYLGRKTVEPYSPEELKAAGFESELDGPLVDYASKGNKVDLEGIEKVEGHDAYKLKVTMKGGQVQHLWLDAQTFLEVKVEGTPRRMDSKMRSVSVYLRDYKLVSGVKVPYVIETAVEGNKDTHKILIDSVAVNAKLDDALFAKPNVK